MPVSLRLSDQRVFSQLKNNRDFSENTGDYTDYVKANVLEIIKIESDVVVGWWADSSNGNFIQDTVDNTKGYIYVPSIDWINEGFSVGDSITSVNNGAIGNFGGVVESINNDRLYISNGAPLPSSGELGDTCEVWGTNYLSAVDFGYKLVTTGDSFNITSRFTQTDQRYFVVDVPTFGIGDGEPFDPTNQAWVSGNLQVEDLGPSQNDSIDTPANTYRKYKISQEIIITPFYLEGELNNLKNKLAPSRFKGENTLDYQFRAIFKDSAQNPNTEKKFELTSWNSNIGWFGENVNGFPNNYEVTEVIYIDLDEGGNLPSIEAGKNIQIFGRISDKKANITVNTRLTFGIVKLLEDSEYNNSTQEWRDLWLFDSVTAAGNEAGVVNSSIITNFDVFAALNNECTFIADISYTPEQLKQIQNGDDYLVFVQIQDISLTNAQSDKVCLILDLNEFIVNTDVKGLTELDYMRIYDGREVFDSNTLGGNTSIKCFNESELMLDILFRLQREKDPVIKSVKFTLGAYNSSQDNYFEIQEYTLPLSFTVVDGVQKVSFQGTRGYLLLDTNQFNIVTFNDEGDDVDEVVYRSQIGLKVNWQEWLEKIGVDTVFLNENAPFDGFNQKTSNYSLKEGYEIRCWMDLVLTAEGVDTEYRLLSNRLEVTDYDTEHVGNSIWNSCTIQTFTLDGLTNLNGNIQDNKNTLVKAVFDAVDNITDPLLYWGVLRIERQEQKGFEQNMLHSQFSPISTSPLQPLPGETELNVSIEGGNLVLSGIIDYTKLEKNTNYSLSAEADQIDPLVISGAYSIAYNKTSYN